MSLLYNDQLGAHLYGPLPRRQGGRSFRSGEVLGSSFRARKPEEFFSEKFCDTRIHIFGAFTTVVDGSEIRLTTWDV